MIVAAVITVSDSCAAGTREDRSGPAVAQRLRELGHQVAAIHVVADVRPLITAKLVSLVDQGAVHAIFTTGGTGIALRDVTPEATHDAIEREIPGIGEVMRAEGRKTVATAPLSRATAGTRGGVLIVNLPGSPRGAVESLDAIANLIPHMADLLGGKTEHA